MGKWTPIAIACLSGSLSVAQAADWTIKASQNETFEFHDNRLLRSPPLGNSYNTINGLTVDARALTPTSSLELIGGVNYRTFAGPGEVNSLNTLDNNMSARFEKRWKLTDFHVYASQRQNELSTVQLEETGVATLTGSVTTQTIGGGFKHLLTPRDSVASETSLTSTGFTLKNSTPFTNLTSTLSWTHNVDPITDFTPSLQFQKLDFDNATQSEVTFWRGVAGVQRQLNKILQFRGEAGFAALKSENNGAAGAVQNNSTGNVNTAINPAGLPSGSSIDWVANAALTFKPAADMSFTATAAKAVAPTTLGQFQLTETVSVGGSYIINQSSSFSVTTALTKTSSVSLGAANNAANSLTAAAVYAYRLGREWQSTFTYRYVQRQSNGAAQDNAIIVTLSRDFTILPGPGR